MIGRLREAVRGAARRAAQRRVACPDSGAKEVIQGCAGNVIIVKSPNTEYFKEAIFILSEDLFARRGVDRAQLLRQARSAAGAYVSARVPPRGRGAWRALAFYLLGALSALGLSLLLRIL